MEKNPKSWTLQAEVARQVHDSCSVFWIGCPVASLISCMPMMLLKLQGGKQEWHIATGVPFKSKKLSADEMSQMVDRLCTPKHEADNLPPKPHVSQSTGQPTGQPNCYL